MNDMILRSQADLRAHYAQPSGLAVAKQMACLDRHCRAFIALSPLLVIASSDDEGRLDATPRGDAPGFVAVLDERRLVIPDRRGNNRLDTLLNVIERPQIGLVFFVPGVNETLRVNGTAQITVDPSVLEPMTAQGKIPTTAIMVSVEEVYFHCGKALIRSHVWDPAKQVDRARFPSLGAVLADQIGGGDQAAYEERIETSYQTALY